MNCIVLCAEDLDPGGDLNETSSSSSSEGNKENSRPSSADPSPRAKGLSRRQRKNRRREDTSPKKPKAKKGMDQKQLMHTPLKHWTKLSLPEQTIHKFLRSYLLSREQMLTMGYPIESDTHKGKTIIFKSGPLHPHSYKHLRVDIASSKFDVNAQEFVPRSHNLDSPDSGQGSGSSSDSGEVDSEDSNGAKHQMHPTTSLSFGYEKTTLSSSGGKPVTCTRCKGNFLIEGDKQYAAQNRCIYHWGKLQSVFIQGERRTTFGTEYSCCGSPKDSAGCSWGKMHVWSGITTGFNGPYDYIRTKSRKTPPPDGNHGVYSLDCEMVYTINGMELARVTVVGLDGRLVYDTHVRPECEVIDYNTRFSGITARDLKSATKTLKDVQNDLMGFISADTILVGHALENDLRVLRIVHYSVIDTAVAFPHYNGLPYRRSLRSLVSCFLRREIQRSPSGHDSLEDSRACMDLMLWRVRKDFIGLIGHYQ